VTVAAEQDLDRVAVLHRREIISTVEGSTGSILHINQLQLILTKMGTRLDPAIAIDGAQNVDHMECSGQ